MNREEFIKLAMISQIADPKCNVLEAASRADEWYAVAEQTAEHKNADRIANWRKIKGHL